MEVFFMGTAVIRLDSCILWSGIRELLSPLVFWIQE